MPSLEFLPSLPPSLNLLTAISLLLVTGILGARLMTRALPVPAITGYVLTGLLIGPALLGFVTTAALDRIGLLVDLALGLVLFELGRRVDFQWLLREKRLLITGVAISLVTFAALYWLLIWFGFGSLIASMGAAIGMATSPAVALAVTREVKAEGQLTERMLNIVAIGNVFSFVGFSMGLSVLHLEYDAGWHSYVLHPLYLFVGSVLLGWIASRLLIHLGGFIGRDGQAQLVLTIALIAATVGVATMLKLSALIALLAFGIASRTGSARHALVETDFGPFNALLYVFLFVFAGAKLELRYFIEMAPIVFAFVALRFAVAIFFTTTLSSFNGMSLRKGALLGLSLIPLSGFKVIMVQHAASFYPLFSGKLVALMVSILVILEIIGPLCTRYALVASGESKT
jgi:Kef-type K+ transport system membrane component KefB